MSYTVTLQAANGRTLDVRVTAESDERACRAAVRTLPRAEGWRALRCVPSEWLR